MAYVFTDQDAALGILPGTTGQVDPNAFGAAGDAGTASGGGSGRFGFSLNLGGNGVGGAFSSIWNWLNRPFSTPLSPTDIFLLTGVILIAVILWNLILYHIRIAAESI